MLNHSGQMNIKTGINIKSECLRHFGTIRQKKKTVEKPSFLELITHLLKQISQCLRGLLSVKLQFG